MASRRNLKDGRHGAKVSRRTVVAVDDADVADSRALPATRRVWVSFLEMRAAGESQADDRASRRGAAATYRTERV